MPFQFSLKTRGFDELKEYFSDLPRNLRGIASEAASDDLIGDGALWAMSIINQLLP